MDITLDYARRRERDSGLRRRRSHSNERPNMNELRILLLGKNALANCKVRNFILAIYESETSKADVEQLTERVGRILEDRHITVINAPHLLQPNLSLHQITKEVKECVHLCDPGPHAIILVLQHNDLSEDDIQRVQYVLNQFSEKAIKHTMVLTTDTETQSSQMSCVLKNNALHQLIKECGGGHFQFDQKEPGCYSDIIQRVDSMNEKYEEFVRCEVFDDAEEGTSVDKEQSTSDDSAREEEEDDIHEELQEPIEGHKKRNVGGGFLSYFFGKKEQSPEPIHPNVSRKAKLNLVLCGTNAKHKASVSKIFRGTIRKTSSGHQGESRLVCVKKTEMVYGRLITVVELPALIELSEEEVINQTLRCVSLCPSGVHLFLLVIPVGPLTDEDKTELEKIQKIFHSQEHFMVLFTTDFTVDQTVSHFVTSKKTQRIVDLYGSFYSVMVLNDHKNSKQISDLFKCIDSFKMKPYSLQMYIKAQEKSARHELEKKLSEMETEIKELQQKIEQKGDEVTPDSGFLRIVLIGKTGNGKSETGNTILRREEFHTEASSDSVTTVCMKGIGEVQGRSVAVVDTPGLFDTTLSNENMLDEIVKCVSLSAPGPHVFIIVLSVGRFTKEEKDTVDLIKMIFGPKAAQFSIVLFTRGDDLKNETIEQYVGKSKNADLKKLIRDCGNRFLVFNNRDKIDNAQVTCLLNMIEEVKKSNKGQYFTNDMFEEAEMSIKKRMEEILKEKEREIQEKYDKEMENMMEKLEKEKEKADEERVKMENQFREKQETLRKEFEEKEKAEQKIQEEKDKKRSDEEQQQKAEYHQKIEEMQREMENQRLLYEKQQKEKEEEDKKREEKYKQDKKKLKDEQKRAMAQLRKEQEEETKRRDLEEQKRKKEEEDERQKWERKIKEHEHDKQEIKEKIQQQQREWEKERKKQMKEREEEERKRKERHEEQLREKQEELEKMRKKSEREREEERQKIEKEIQQWRDTERRVREQKERELEEKKNEIKKHYEQLAQERKEEWEKIKREEDERKVEERKKWSKKIEDFKRKQEEEISKRKEKEEKERDKMKEEYEQKIKEIKKEHEYEARKQAEEFNEFRNAKNQHIQELSEKLKERQEEYEVLERLYNSIKEIKSEEITELQKEIEQLKKKRKCVIQ